MTSGGASDASDRRLASADFPFCWGGRSSSGNELPYPGGVPDNERRAVADRDQPNAEVFESGV